MSEHEKGLEVQSGVIPVALYHDQVAEIAKGGNVENLPKGYYIRPQFLGTLIATCCASMVAYVGWVLPANTLLLINADLGASPNITWVVIVWVLGSAVGYTLVGRLSDIFGRRWFILGTSLFGLIGNIIAATAQSVNTLIAANVFNGLAASGQLSFAVIIGELVPNRARGPYNDVVLFSSMPFAVFGPVIARSFIQHTHSSWRWSYYLGIILSVISIVLYFLFYRPPHYALLHVNGKTKMQQVKTLDFLGITLYSAGSVLLLLGLNWGGASYPWRSAHVIATMVVGSLTLVAFGFWEAYSNQQYPLIPMRLFRNIPWVAITVCATVGAMIYYSMTVLWPQVIFDLYTTNVSEVGWMSCAVGGGLLAGQLLGGLGIRYLPRMKIQMVISALFVLVFVGAIGSISEDNRSQTVAFLLLGCIGVGYVENLTLSSVALVWEPEDIGLATGVLGSIRSMGGSVATAVYTSIYANKLTANLPKYVAPAALNAGLPSSSLPALFAGIGSGSFDKVPGISNAIIAAITRPLRTAYSKSFSVVFLATIAFSCLLLGASLLAPNVEDYLTGNVARKLIDGSEASTITKESFPEQVSVRPKDEETQ